MNSTPFGSTVVGVLSCLTPCRCLMVSISDSVSPLFRGTALFAAFPSVQVEESRLSKKEGREERGLNLSYSDRFRGLRCLSDS